MEASKWKCKWEIVSGVGKIWGGEEKRVGKLAEG